MTTTSALTLAAWSLVAARLVVLASRSVRARRVPVAAQQRADEWRPRVTSGCGR
jgi:hypothetical protein